MDHPELTSPSLREPFPSGINELDATGVSSPVDCTNIDHQSRGVAEYDAAGTKNLTGSGVEARQAARYRPTNGRPTPFRKRIVVCEVLRATAHSRKDCA